ncbi:MAG: elongation factor G [Myxococcota bacterium]
MRTRDIRNIGISAHIDSGKTTLTERILFYSGRIHRMNEVRGDGAGATMDHQPLEIIKGITITAAATQVDWREHKVNIIDTPGHVDFTVEVERSLRVLDGAILVLCSVGGVQSQSMTVDRQMRRHRVPRLAFINKMDRVGADAHAVLEQLRAKLGLHAALAQLPIGAGAEFQGVIDLVQMRAVFNDGEHGERMRFEAIPEALRAQAEESRNALVEAVSDEDDTLIEAVLEGRSVPADQLAAAIRSAVLGHRFVPVFVGTAMKNKGVQPLLDAVVDYLPSPLDAEPQRAQVVDSDRQLELRPDPNAPLVAMAFKLAEDDHGQLTYVRVYQGTLQKGAEIRNTRTGRRAKVGRLVRMHANERTDILSAGAGDIVAMIGNLAASGDTLVAPDLEPMALESIYAPAPVISLAISGKDSAAADKVSKALARFAREDPTFRVSTDPESGQTLISGMGELHLEVYVDRLRRDHGVEVRVGDPRVSYREAIRRRVDFDHLLRKQTGGPGQVARVIGYVEPLEGWTGFEFVDQTKSGVIPTAYIPACEKGARDAMSDGPLAGFPVEGVRVVITDGVTHPVDSSEWAFRAATRTGVREALERAGLGIREPVMRVVIETPAEHQGAVIGDLSRRRGAVTQSETQPEQTRIVGHVPLARMFGYSTDLRSSTKGCAEFSMELDHYAWAPSDVESDVVRRGG